MEAHWKNICKHEGHVGVSHSSELECYKLLSVLQHFSCKIKEKRWTTEEACKRDTRDEQ